MAHVSARRPNSRTGAESDSVQQALSAGGLGPVTPGPQSRLQLDEFDVVYGTSMHSGFGFPKSGNLPGWSSLKMQVSWDETGSPVPRLVLNWESLQAEAGNRKTARKSMCILQN